jgi:DNA polymerase IV
MHIDLNSCFATHRHKPVAIAAYDTPGDAVIASSYEAKALGIKLGVNMREARLLSQDVIVMVPEPEKYFDAHRRCKRVLLNYTNAIIPSRWMSSWSTSTVPRLCGKSLEDVGHEIKADIKQTLGEYVTVNVGYRYNRSLAKSAPRLDRLTAWTLSAYSPPAAPLASIEDSARASNGIPRRRTGRQLSGRSAQDVQLWMPGHPVRQ